MNTRELENFLGRLLRGFRQTEIDPLRRRLDAIERRGADDTIAERVFAGEPVDERQWRQFVRGIEHPASGGGP